MTFCAMDMAARTHAVELANDSEFADAVETMAAELVKPGYCCDPLKPANLDEAIGEVLCKIGSKFVASLAALLKAKDCAGAGTLCEAASRAYWNERAKDIAEDRVHRGVDARGNALSNN